MTLPVVSVTADSLPAAWEEAVIQTWEQGATIATQYDHPGDPPSRDAIAVIAVRHPLADPRIHRAMPGGLDDLEVYRQEVVHGVHDHWIDPGAGKWQYTYHERLCAYSVPGLPEPIDQIAYVVEALTENPHTRRAQAMLWKPWEDAGIGHPACLQRLWFRLFDDELVLNAHMRSNDAFKAAFMNMYAFTELQREVAQALTERLGRQITAGQYTHIADSFHIYGSYFDEFRRFLETLEKRSFEQRVFRMADVEPILEEARARIAAQLAREAGPEGG
jgi:thymidylate synthase